MDLKQCGICEFTVNADEPYFPYGLCPNCGSIIFDPAERYNCIVRDQLSEDDLSRRRAQPVTILHREGGWSYDFVRMLAADLVYKYPELNPVVAARIGIDPDRIIIRGNYSKGELSGSLPDEEVFGHQIVIGCDSDDLPFCAPVGW